MRAVDMRGHQAAIQVHFKNGQKPLMVYFDTIEEREAWVSGYAMCAQSGDKIAALDSLHVGEMIYNAAVMITGLVDSEELEGLRGE